MGRRWRKARLSIRHADAPINIWEGSVRSGKTIASLLAWIAFVRCAPKGDLLMVGRTERTLNRNIIELLIAIVGPDRCSYNAGKGEVILCGRRIYVVGANDEAATGKIQGMTLAGAYVDEATLLPESFWTMLGTRLSVAGARLFATCNPDSPSHYLKRDYLDKASMHITQSGKVVRHDVTDGELDGSGRGQVLHLHRFSFNLLDNPSLDPAYVKRVEATYTGLWALRYIRGLWVIADGAIYDAFDVEDPTMVGTLPEGVGVKSWVVALDHGSVNPLHALLLGLTTDNRIYIAEEYRFSSREAHRQMSDMEYSAALREWLTDLDPASQALPSKRAGARNPDKVIVDPAATGFIIQLNRDDWSGVRTARNTVIPGIRNTASLFHARKILIDPSCVHLIREVAGYVWDTKAAKAGEERPLKVDDHGPDAMRYGVMGTKSWWRFWLAFDHG